MPKFTLLGMKNSLKHSLILMGTMVLSSCSLFKQAKVSDSVEEAKKRVCLSSEGKGRFIFSGQKHVFSYQSHFDEEEKTWETLIDFPVYGRESLHIKWNEDSQQAEYDASYEQALLKNADNLDPKLLDAATTLWVEFFEDALVSRGELSKDSGATIVWKTDPKSLTGALVSKGAPSKITFLNPNPDKGHFGRFDFELKDSKGDTSFGMQLIVRNCLENPKN